MRALADSSRTDTVIFIALWPARSSDRNRGELARQHPPNTVYVGLALGVCAGSSLFTTAATSGPLAQALTERADLRDSEGRPLRFGFTEFLPVGVVSFVVIEAIAVGYCLVTVHYGW